MPRFHLTDISQRLCLFQPGRVAARISARSVDHRDALVLLFDQLRDVCRDLDIVVRMSDDDKDVHFVALIRRYIFLRLRPDVETPSAAIAVIPAIMQTNLSHFIAQTPP